MKRNHSDWGSNTSPSAPVAPTRPRLVPMGGFVFTDYGIAHDLSQEEADAFANPPIAPRAGGGSR